MSDEPRFEARLLIPGGADPLTEVHTAPHDPREIGPAPTPPTVDLRAVVDGVDCKNGHFNDPKAHFCQVCGIAMAQLTLVPRQGRRPSLGVLLFDDSSTYRLDADYVIGRDPQPGDARPIRLAYQVGGVSRQHVRVSLVGWTVFVTDLGSANGTVLVAPGATAERRLTPGEAVPIVAGTQVRMRGRWFRYESHRSGVGS
ncbi:MAG: FHA domain-containing protein [Hamadaea sp.]|nr:FHA domain-containing protein [Hamadaea sp.]